MIKRKILGAVCAGFCIAGAYSSEANAQATDRWTGLYGGGHVGAGWVDGADATISPANAATQAVLGPFIAAGVLPTDYSLDPEGFLAGLLMGYNWAFGSFLIGIEGDFSLTSIQGSDNRPRTNTGGFADVFINEYDIDIPWIATLRGRLGVFADPNVLLYATGGLAIAEVDQSHIFRLSNGNAWSGESRETETGYAVGGGVEWALNSNWSVKGEYLYVSVDTDDFQSSVAGTFPLFPCTPAICTWNVQADDIELHTARLGINYKFGAPRPPAEPLK